MQKFIPALKIALMVSIAIILAAIVLNLVFATTASALKMMFPLLMGLYAYWFITNTNWAPVTCPTCSTRQPTWRTPTSFGQMMWGGYTCANCGTDMDRNGRVIAPDSNRAA